MPRRDQEKFKIYVNLPEEVFNKFLVYKDKFGLTRNQLGSICVQAGLNQVIQALNPADAVPAEKMAEIIEALDKRGYVLRDVEEKPK